MFREFHYHRRGRGHALEGTPGQDRTSYLSRRGVQVICLSDGAGSATHSEFGAQTLAEKGAVLLAESFEEVISSDDGAHVKLEIMRGLLDRLAETAKRRECEIADLAATFLAVAVSGTRFLVVHVGDGVIGYVKNGELKVVSAPDNDEFANSTTFVTSERAAHSMRLLRGSTDGVAGFILMSDGAEASLHNRHSGRLAPACVKLIDAVAAAPRRGAKHPKHERVLRRFVDTVVAQSTKDDCSIGILASAKR